ncbi:MAG: hypothetical protein ACKPKO_64290, partial [Candidatus Fonsibacter sp.]
TSRATITPACENVCHPERSENDDKGVAHGRRPISVFYPSWRAMFFLGCISVYALRTFFVPFNVKFVGRPWL